MKLRAIHLLNRMERIERDLSEISTLRSTLQDDREYTSRLRTSLQDETLRLRELEAKILTQVIQNPPESLARTAVGTSTATRSGKPVHESPAENPAPGRAPEIIVPGAKRKNASGHAPETKSVPARAPKNKRADAAPAKSGSDDGDAAADESFNFTFVQK